MRRYLPFIILAVGLLALFVSLPSNLTNFNRPGSNPPEKIDTKLGLDLQGGLRGEYRAVTTDGSTPSGEQMDRIRDIIENRVNATGVAEPIVQRQGADRVVVEIPGVADEQAVRRLIGSTGKLDFVPLPPDRYGNNTSPSDDYPGPGTRLYERDPTLQPLFTGDQIDPNGVAAVPNTDPGGGGGWAVSFSLLEEGRRKFSDYTRANIGNFFAIVLDGAVVSAPSIQSQIEGQGQITGSFDAQSAQDLATTLKFGALPLEIEEVGFNSISATLGLDFLRQSILAAIIGIALVFAFMIVYYRLPGLVACGALLYYMLIIYAIFRLVPVTLTLAGVAAFVLSVGMAVDANVLIFERMKEELRAGKPLNSAIEAGFNRAWNSIIDSNVSSLITAFILFYAGSSVIRGFALVLIIGVLASMFTAITLSRTILRWVVRQPWARTAKFFGVREEEFVLSAPRTARGREASARV